MRWLPTSNPERRDRRIADGLRRGDERALVALHEAYGRTVFGYLVHAFDDRARAEDVFQQVLTEVWRRGADFDPGRGSLLAWLMTMTRSRAIDELRRRVPEPRDPSMLRTQDVDPAPGQDVLVERWVVAALLERLPDEEARLLRMRFHDDLSQSQIAERTGLALGTVKTRMVRGLTRLRDLAASELGEGHGATVPRADAVGRPPAAVGRGVPA